MKGPLSHPFIRLAPALRLIPVALAVLALTACGGGSGSSLNDGSNLRMSLSAPLISISATTVDVAPVTGFNDYVPGLVAGLSPYEEVYISTSFTSHGIERLRSSSGSNELLAANHPGPPVYMNFEIDFKNPSLLAPGTYNDTVTVSTCLDSFCHHPLSNSPQTIKVQYTVTKPKPIIDWLYPELAQPGGLAFTLEVDGSYFTPKSVVLWNGAKLATTYLANNELKAQVPAADIAIPTEAAVSVTDSTYNATSDPSTFIVTADPVLSSITPASLPVGGTSFTLTVIGTGFGPESVIQWNGNNLTTTYVSDTKLTSRVPASDISTSGTAQVTVYDPTFKYGSGSSNSEIFAIMAPLALDSVSPAKVTVGGPSFMLTVLGAGYSKSAVVQWNGTALTTSYVSSTEIVAQVPATDISATGIASVAVDDPASVAGSTSAQSVSIVPVSIDAVAYQMNPAHTGAVTFKSVTFPSSAAWSVDVDGWPSYAMIADGLVFVTVNLSDGDTELLALNQTTGDTAWGPITFPIDTATGSYNSAIAAYDNGRVYVSSGATGSAATLQAYDAKTGTLDWSAAISGIAPTGAVTAADGIVYVEGQDDGGMLYAVDESTGAVLWKHYAEGDDSDPAVTADGVYVLGNCETFDFRPATGELLWDYINSGCNGRGGAITTVANQLLYSPNAGNYYAGEAIDPETGTVEGTYTADAPPAFTTSMGYFLQKGTPNTLDGVTLSDNTVQWTFTGDGDLIGAPIVVNNYVFIGSSSGNLYALDGLTGDQKWDVDLGTAIIASFYSEDLSGLSAGDGLLVVPSENKITAYTLSTDP